MPELIKELVYSEAPFEVFREHTPTEEMFALLEATLWGTGKTVYQHFGNRAHFLHIQDPHIFTLREHGALRAFTVFVRRELEGFPNGSKAYYIRFFCASPEVKGHGIVKRLAEIVIDAIRIKEGTSCFYATIEAKNPAVKRVMEKAGFEAIATVKTLGFSRFFPPSTLPIRELSEADYPQMESNLERSFRQCSFWTTENLFQKPGYFVFEKDGHILLGAQTHQAHWAIHRLPGLAGHLLPVLPFVPLFKRVFNPLNFKFLSIEALYITAEGAPYLEAFLESLLKQTGNHTLLTWADERAQITTAFAALNKGIIHPFVKDANVLFIASFNSFPQELATQIRNTPVYISSYDSL